MQPEVYNSARDVYLRAIAERWPSGSVYGVVASDVRKRFAEQLGNIQEDGLSTRLLKESMLALARQLNRDGQTVEVHGNGVVRAVLDAGKTLVSIISGMGIVINDLAELHWKYPNEPTLNIKDLSVGNLPVGPHRLRMTESPDGKYDTLLDLEFGSNAFGMSTFCYNIGFKDGKFIMGVYRGKSPVNQLIREDVPNLQYLFASVACEWNLPTSRLIAYLMLPSLEDRWKRRVKELFQAEERYKEDPKLFEFVSELRQ